MGEMSRRCVAVQELASHYWEYPYVFRSVSGIKFGEFSGMVPEWFRNQILVDFPEWFRKRSMYRLRIYWCNLMRIQSPVVSSAKNCVTLSIVLLSYFGGPCKCLKEYVGFPHGAFLGFPESVRMRSVDSCLTESISVIVVTIWLWVLG